MRTRFTILMVAMLMALSMPAYAGGSVYCGSLGHGYTTAGAGSSGLRTHYFADSVGQTVGEGTEYHGTHSGWASWDITGVGEESANCPQ